jgi:hypothetical protein
MHVFGSLMSIGNKQSNQGVEAVFLKKIKNSAQVIHKTQTTASSLLDVGAAIEPSAF